MKKHEKLFEILVSTEYLFLAWQRFRSGKTKRYDVQKFSVDLEKNIFRIQSELKSGLYQHGGYYQFKINDPKPRLISKASVKDRFIHQAVFTILYQVYNSKFYEHSYSSRVGKGTHRAIKYFKLLCNKVSKNYTRSVWVLKLDIRKFFDTVDHEKLKKILKESIADEQFLQLLFNILDSFSYADTRGKGIPLGNVTSQIFTNIYLNKLDQFIKHTLKRKSYLRYADDLILLGNCKSELTELIPKIEAFLVENLSLNLNPKKIILRPLHQGADCLGYIQFLKYLLVRTRTIRRMHCKLENTTSSYISGNVSYEDYLAVFNSYIGLLGHANTFKMQCGIKNMYHVYPIFVL